VVTEGGNPRQTPSMIVFYSTAEIGRIISEFFWHGASIKK
jgi:hypothetical protein